MSCFEEIQEKLCYGQETWAVFLTALVLQTQQIFECMCVCDKFHGTRPKVFLGILQREHL